MLSSPSAEKTSTDFRSVSSRRPPSPFLEHFLESLFDLLDRYEVRYCILHSYEELPHRLEGDLDLAIHPDDPGRLPQVVSGLKEKGRHPLQCLEYAVKGHYLVFGRLTESSLETIAVDFITEHRRDGVILASGATLVKDRRRLGRFWVPAPAVEFSYLLAKKTLKGSMTGRQSRRLRALCGQIGPEAGEGQAAQLFGKRWGTKVVRACIERRLGEDLPRLRRKLRATAWTKRPQDYPRYWWGECRRVLRRWRQPTGLFVVVLGSDGAGKSTLIEGLTEQVGKAFRRCCVFHWRPMVLGNRRPGGPVTDPHGRSVRSSLSSVLRLLWWVLDYWCGYWLVIRPWIARSGLAVFDRYYDDLAADPKRFRYGGPLWLVKAFEILVPRPDVLLALDAPATVIHSRKQELDLAEIERQRTVYLSFAEAGGAAVLDAAREQSDVLEEAARTLSRRLARRFEDRHPSWLAGVPQQRAQGLRATPGLSRRQNFDLALHMLATANENGNGLRLATNAAKSGRPRHPPGSFVLLPSKAEPRWLLPLESKRLTLAGLQLCSANSRRARVARGLLRWSTQAGFAGRLGERFAIPEDVWESVNALVEETIGARDSLFALSVGTPGRYCKLTVQVMAPDSEILGYLKIPLTDGAAVLVCREARTLRQLQEFEGIAADVPSVLYAGEWAGQYVLFQSPLEGRPSPASLGAAHHGFLNRLSAVYRTANLGPHVVDGVAERWKRLARGTDADWLPLGERALAWADGQLASTSVPCGLSHGDFAPWNTRLEQGRLRVFDWESAAWGVPLCWDRFHFEVQVESTLGRRRSLSKRQVAIGDRALFALYLVRSLCEGYDEGMEQRGIEFRRRKLIELTSRAC